MKSLFLLLLSTLLCAQITLDEISTKPASRAKNFLIWQFFQQDITPKEADAAFDQIQNVNSKLFYMYAKKTDREDIHYLAKCMSLPANEILKSDDNSCMQIAMTPWGAALYSKPEIKELEERVLAPKTKRYLNIMSSDLNETTLMKYDPTDVLTVINGAGKKYRQDHFNQPFSPEFIKFISKSSKISQFVEATINDEKMDKVEPLLVTIDPKKLSANTTFVMAIHYLLQNKKEIALRYLAFANTKYSSQIDKDKTIFWNYLITQEMQQLQILSQSSNINIYTLYAKEILKIDTTNYFTAESMTLKSKEIEDPFVWIQTNSKLKTISKDALLNLADEYRKNDMVVLEGYTLEMAHSYKIANYILPYMDYTQTLNNDDKALLYSLMRQESQFIPSVISTSYALGLMQLMPFVVDSLSKKMPNKVSNYNQMFDPQTNISYAIKHLEWLHSQLDNPLFIAYAYNGGLGFLKRYIKSGKFTTAPYEPFLSMDTMTNVESREYGKKVLANYVIYKKILNEDFSIVHFFDTLKAENQTSHLQE
jgi:soluble lytic murein transglycosylase